MILFDDCSRMTFVYFLHRNCIHRQEKSVVLSQAYASRKILFKFGNQNCKGVMNPMESKLILKPPADDEKQLPSTPYIQLVGCITYLIQRTRLDMSFVIGTLSKFLKTPSGQHWTATKRVLRHLQSTENARQTYPMCEKSELVAYSDADWESSFGRKSTSGILVYYGDKFVSWCSKKHPLITLSFTDSELIAATEALRKLKWIHSLLKYFGGHPGVPTLFCESQPAIAIKHTSGYHGRVKHMDVRYKFLEHCLETGAVKVLYVLTTGMVAIMMTKPLSQL